MAHKTLIGGTAYNVTSGTSMVSGTTYNIAGGKTLVGGTGYDINFKNPKYAMLYSDGDFVFQEGNEVADGKTLTASYTEFENASTPPWNGQQYSFTSVDFKTEVAPTNMSNWFAEASNMVANIDNFSNLDMNNVTNMYMTYWHCTNLTGSPVCGPNVTHMGSAYTGCTNLTGSPVCGNKVTDMIQAYTGCTNLTGSPVCGPNVMRMWQTYASCTNLTGSPACGNKVTDMCYAYFSCTNLTGSPVCGKNVTDMSSAYTSCRNLTGSPVCGPNVIDMSLAYYHCDGLTGSPACGNKVTNMSNAYYGCVNLTGSPVCGNNVTNMAFAYYGCKKATNNAYLYSSVVSNMQGCFGSRNLARRLNVYVQSGSTTNTVIHYSNTSSVVTYNITWTNAGTYQYNTYYNIYIYPVANVAAARAANEGDTSLILLQDFEYEDNGEGIKTLTGWKGTTNGVASTELIIPDYDFIEL